VDFKDINREPLIGQARRFFMEKKFVSRVKRMALNREIEEFFSSLETLAPKPCRRGF
jgi:hypothetical protein